MDWNRHFCAEKYEQRAQKQGAAYFRAWRMLGWQVHVILGTRRVSMNTVPSERCTLRHSDARCANLEADAIPVNYS